MRILGLASVLIVSFLGLASVSMARPPASAPAPACNNVVETNPLFVRIDLRYTNLSERISSLVGNADRFRRAYLEAIINANSLEGSRSSIEAAFRDFESAFTALINVGASSGVPAGMVNDWRNVRESGRLFSQSYAYALSSIRSMDILHQSQFPHNVTARCYGVLSQNFDNLRRVLATINRGHVLIRELDAKQQEIAQRMQPSARR